MGGELIANQLISVTLTDIVCLLDLLNPVYVYVGVRFGRRG